MKIDDIKEDPGFLRLFFQSIFNILIKPIQLAWSNKEKTLHGYIAAILAIGIFLYFFILGIFSSVSYVYAIFYEDQFNRRLQIETKVALDAIFLDSCKNGVNYIHPEKLGNNSGALFFKDGKRTCTSSKGGSFYPISSPINPSKGIYNIKFVRKDKDEKYFNFYNVTLKKFGLFSYKILNISQTSVSVGDEGILIMDPDAKQIIK